MSDKLTTLQVGHASTLQMGHASTIPLAYCPADHQSEKARAEAWKAMAYRLAAVAEHIGYDTCEGIGIVRKADEALKAFDALKRSDP